MPFPARQLYFEAVKVGDELPPLVRPPIERVQLVRYAGASGDYNPLHVDEQFARQAGFPGVFAPGMMAMGLVAQLVTDWLRGARIEKYGARFVKIVWPGDVITARGRVVDRKFEGPGRYVAEIEVWAENQRGELVLKGVVSAQLFYNAEDEARQRAGSQPLVVSKEEEEARLLRMTRGGSLRRPVPPAAPLRPPPPPPPPQPAVQPAPRVAAAPVKPGRAAAKPAHVAKPAKRPAAKAKPRAKAKPARAARRAPPAKRPTKKRR